MQDLHHDGKLYSSRQGFSEKAKRINQYIKDWEASGFRSGFMFHNLDWLHDLNINYDASTFDTDPFEPQPDGVNTIFPFWVPDSKRGGFFELPYTLPQDSTLFLVFREKTIDIWLQKLDWIAEKGGMALVNVHPDYMAFPKDSASKHLYPMALYKEFLEWVKQKYAVQYWHACPKDIAAYCQQTFDGVQRGGKA